MQMILQNFLRTVKDNYDYDIDKECKFIEFFIIWQHMSLPNSSCKGEIANPTKVKLNRLSFIDVKSNKTETNAS